MSDSLIHEKRGQRKNYEYGWGETERRRLRRKSGNVLNGRKVLYARTVHMDESRVLCCGLAWKLE